MDTSWTNQHPRLIALGMFLAGVAALGVLVAIGGVEMGTRAGNKAIFLVGIAGIAAGVGLAQLLWPPRPDQGDGRGVFARASWPQRILWVVGGLAGIVAAAVVQTVASGKI